RAPDHFLAADAIADRTADKRARRRRDQKDEQTELCVLGRKTEMMLEIEQVIGGNGGEIEILREQQRDQHRDGAGDDGARERRRRGVTGARAGARLAGALIPARQDRQDRDAAECGEREPRDARLAARQNEERRGQRTKRGTEIAADLEQRLREAVLSARG